MWSGRSFRPLNDSSSGRRNFRGIGHSKCEGKIRPLDHPIQVSIRLLPYRTSQLIHLSPHFPGEFSICFFRGIHSLVIVSSVVIFIVILVGPIIILLMLQLQPHFLVLSYNLLYVGCECLYLQGKCCRTLWHARLRLNSRIEWNCTFGLKHDIVVPTDGVKLMMLKSSVDQVRPDESARACPHSCNVENRVCVVTSVV